jgi:hypothetical protein
LADDVQGDEQTFPATVFAAPGVQRGKNVSAVVVRLLGGGPGDRVMAEWWCARQDGHFVVTWTEHPWSTGR